VRSLPAGEQQLNFCTGNEGELRRCETTRTIEDTLDALIQLRSNILKESCMEYKPEASLRDKDACNQQCSDTDPQLQFHGGGSFKKINLPDSAVVQQYIRKSGGAISQVDIHDDFENFFKNNPMGIYPGPGPNAKLEVCCSECCLSIRGQGLARAAA
jgi:hypothetical protein